MAKPKDKAVKEEKAPKVEAPKYDINDLGEALDISPQAARVKLRAAKVEKNGGRYGWDTKAEFNEVVSLLKSPKKAKKKAKDEEADEDDK